ncbi:tail fiber domain-containing protein [Luteibacter sp.]|jgi:hypothetical protein|uniref:tail fiber domain-containing protein n=1 Tax=Luteibacter sp. TaxID=1886636 RepID=UPI002F415AEC
MRRINTSDGLYHNADVLAGVQGTVVDADALNAIQEEIIAVITDAGMELDASSNTQLRDAIAAITGAGVEWGAIKNKPATFPSTILLVAGLSDALGLLAPKASPALTGIPTAPTAAAGTNNGQIASTAFVSAVVKTLQTALDGKSNVGHGHAIADVAGLQSSLDGKVSKAGDTMTGWLDVAPPEGTSATIRLNAAPSSNNALIYQKGGQNRWSFTGSVNTETGAGNAGSDFVIQAFNDVGTYLRDCVAISRSTGTFYAYGDVSVDRTIYSQGDAIVLGTSGANPSGSLIYLRPAGTNSTSGQVVVRGSNGNLELSQGGSLSLVQVDNASPPNAPVRVGLNGQNANGIGGSFANWNASRMPALQIDAGNDGSAYMIARVTHWGSKHIAGIDAYAAGGNAQLVFHCGTANTHTFDQAGNMTASGRITAIGGFNVSDRREKTNIKRRAVSAGIAARVRKVYSSWNWKHDGQADTGVIAQLLLRFAPQHIREFSRPHKRLMGKQVTRLSVDKPGLALECALDADRRVDEVVKQNAALLRRIEKLERKRT